MKRVDNPERDQSDRRGASVDSHTDRERILSQERVRDCKRWKISAAISLIHIFEGPGIILGDVDSQIPLYVANHSTQHPYHTADPSAINGAPNLASRALYFCSNSLKSANMDMAGMACNARSVESRSRKGSGVNSDEEGSPSEGTVWRMRPGAKR